LLLLLLFFFLPKNHGPFNPLDWLMANKTKIIRNHKYTVYIIYIPETT